MTVAGLTGHQDLGSQNTVAWVSRQLERAIKDNSVDLGITSLAVGADQLFARKLVQLKIPFNAVIPCKRYEETFGGRNLRSFVQLLSKAKHHFTLPFDEPGEHAFYEAGKFIVHECTFLIAVWNGKPAKGLGGTGDIVGYAKATGKTILHINPDERCVRLL